MAEKKDETTTKETATNTSDTETKTEESTKQTTTAQETEEEVEIKIPESEISTLAKQENVDTEALVRNAIKKGSKIAKEQLYPEINRLKNKLGELTTQINASKEEASESKIDTDKLTKLESDKAKLEQEKLEVEDKLGIVEDALVETTHKVDELSVRLNNKELQDYADEKIAELEKDGHKVIKRLVGGKTKEEIDNSIEIAKSEYERVQNTVKKDFKIPEKTDTTTEEKEDPKPITVNRIGTDPASLNTWKKDKSTVLADVYAEARRNMGMPEQ
jgi:hypothetical protein